jgi:hypothetical protein
MTTSRRRDHNPRTVVRLPERELGESILYLAAPLLEALGAAGAQDDARNAIDLAVKVWNAHVIASKVWGSPKTKPLAELRKAMHGTQTAPGAAESFDVLCKRWRQEFAFDPRLVATWTYGPDDRGRQRLVCQTALPAGVEAEIPPPAEKRIVIGGQFLDEVRIRLGANSYLRFPVDNHRAVVDADGVATVYTKMPTALQLFAEGRVPRAGSCPIDIMIGGKIARRAGATGGRYSPAR